MFYSHRLVDCPKLHLIHVFLLGDQRLRMPKPSRGCLPFPSKSFDFISPLIKICFFSFQSPPPPHTQPQSQIQL